MKPATAPAARPRASALAYEAQARWLAHFGRDNGELAIDPLFLELLAVCGLRLA